MGRLTREDNKRLGKSWTYAYDAGGNITSKLEYAYTTGKLEEVTKDYKIVNDTKRKDRLASFNTQSFTYSDDGYPTTYKGESLSWNFRRLKSYRKIDFTYDADNVRRTKKVEWTTTTYYYEGSRLLAEKRDNKCVQYLYDHNGLTGFSSGGYNYLYGKNALGDITEIYSDIGEKVASYAYDAWGNCTVYTASGAIDDDASSIGNTNPFRYRGYYYDVETKLYYLINRYYDPEVGRFISPDHIGYMLMQMEQLNGCNLYAYCLNNPVMHTDPEGTFVWFIAIAFAVGFVVSTTSSAVSQALTNNGEVDWGVALVDGLFGGISSAINVIPGVGQLASAVLDVGLTVANSLITTGMQNGWNISMSDVGMAFGAAAMNVGVNLGLNRLGRSINTTKAWGKALNATRNFNRKVSNGTYFLNKSFAAGKKAMSTARKNMIKSIGRAYTTAEAFLGYGLGFTQNLVSNILS